MIYTDKSLICRHCGTAFRFTAFEQEFYVLNNVTYELECCRACRSARNAPRRPVFLHPPQPLPASRAPRDATCIVCGTTMADWLAPHVGRAIYCAECSARYGSSDAARSPDPVRRIVFAPSTC